MFHQNGYYSRKIQAFKRVKTFHYTVKQTVGQNQLLRGVSSEFVHLNSNIRIGYIFMYVFFSLFYIHRIGKAVGSAPGEYKEFLYEPNVSLFGNGSLHFKKITKEAQGHFLCEAKNNIGAGVSKVIFLKVNGKMANTFLLFYFSRLFFPGFIISLIFFKKKPFNMDR